MGTGRCYVHKEGIVATDMLPCEASAAADVTIALLYGSTAALDSALFGTPTVLLDREWQPYHPLYALGEGRVVFKDWDNLWEALAGYRRDPTSAHGFGDWAPTLYELEEFRDGDAAKRMGEYIGWLCEGLAQGLTREETLVLAHKRYTQLWGSDKVTNLRTDVASPERPVHGS